MELITLHQTDLKLKKTDEGVPYLFVTQTGRKCMEGIGIWFKEEWTIITQVLDNPKQITEVVLDSRRIFKVYMNPDAVSIVTKILDDLTATYRYLHFDLTYPEWNKIDDLRDMIDTMLNVTDDPYNSAMDGLPEGYECDICKKRYTRKGNLKRHRLLHGPQ